ncbi:hypothetical protein B0I37DRAFT_175511 [Chaetomium sp. MPI-CAGE-AT-0009]|nr:hypothetical protein B0I37DRAFT_175511 [Chaetomium sp. MPI-CAGE-AT-0009]
MDAPSAYGSREGAAAWEGSIEGSIDGVQVQVPPEEKAKDEETQPTPTLTPGPQYGAFQQQQDQYRPSSYSRYYHSRTPHAPQISTLSPPPPADEDETVSRARIVERLARKLSKQDLQQRHRTRPRHHRPRQAKPPTPVLPVPTAGVESPELRTFQSWAAHDANSQPQLYPTPPSEDRTIPWLPIPALDVGEPIEIDEAYTELEKPEKPEELEDRRLLDVRRPQRKTSRQLRPSGRPVDQRLEAMIADGTQCNVRSEPQPIPTPTPMPAPSLPGSGLQLADPGFIEPDPECTIPNSNSAIEIDENDTGDLSAFRDELLALTEASTIPLRYASGPGGVRKYTVGGIALRYRLSADVAMRCANVVRSRPRMRKRAKTRGSADTSAVTSPAMSSTQSPPLPQNEFPR